MKKLTWLQLNQRLRKTKREAEVLQLLEEEKASHGRKAWLARIWSRYVRLRNQRERKALQ